MNKNCIFNSNFGMSESKIGSWTYPLPSIITVMNFHIGTCLDLFDAILQVKNESYLDNNDDDDGAFGVQLYKNEYKICRNARYIPAPQNLQILV